MKHKILKLNVDFFLFLIVLNFFNVKRSKTRQDALNESNKTAKGC